MSFRSRDVRISSRSYSALEAIQTLAQASCVDECLDTLILHMIDGDLALQDLSQLRSKAMKGAEQEFRAKHPEWQPKLRIDTTPVDYTNIPN